MSKRIEIKPEYPEDMHERYAKFGKELLDLLHELGCDWFCDEWSEDIMPIAVRCGLAQRVEYDPDLEYVEDCEPGDEIWTWRLP